MKALIIVLMFALTGCSVMVPKGITEDEGIQSYSEIRKRNKALKEPLSYEEAVAYCSEGGVLRGEHLEACVEDAQEKGRGKVAQTPGPAPTVIFCTSSGNMIICQ